MNEMVKTVEVLTATKNLTWICSRFQHTRGICRITLTVLRTATKAAPCTTLEIIPLQCQGCNTHWHQHAELTTCFAPKKYI